MPESFAPTIWINGRGYQLTGVQWLQVYALAGCQWAIEELERIESEPKGE